MGAPPSAPLVLLANFEVEQQWGQGEFGLPTIGFAASDALVGRMDEFALLLGGPGDTVVLKEPPDPTYLDHLGKVGLTLPHVLVTGSTDPARSVTEEALRRPGVIAGLRTVAERGGVLVPHGASAAEERLAIATGLTLGTAAPPVCKKVNSKLYSRRLADRIGLRQPRGWACAALDDWDEALAGARRLLTDGRSVAVKDAYGVSGKGIVRIRDERHLSRLDAMTRRRLERHGAGSLNLVVEEWVAKSADLNYQFTLDRDGGTRFDFVKEAVTERGVHKGHRMPAPLTGAQGDTIRRTAGELGRALADDGYLGVVGVDAMVDPDGGLYPVVEINARLNMSTYQDRLQTELVGPERAALARHYPVRRTEPVSFAELAQALGDLLITSPHGEGLVVNNFATVNASLAVAEPGSAPEGRLYGLVVAADHARVAFLDGRIEARLRGHFGKGAR
ncbi:hypothetical protein [Streptomyces sp. NPDC005538]|uniref:preATP grasp domain-containing protein n=1 Tax=unclassified Streptomyces TaxID=2593676 RepID=UPI0033A73416